MLFLPPGSGRLNRVHGAYVTEQETFDVVEFWKQQAVFFATFALLALLAGCLPLWPAAVAVELPRFCGQVSAFARWNEVVPPFEVDGGHSSDAGVFPVGVVPGLDPAEDGQAGVPPGAEGEAIDELAL